MKSPRSFDHIDHLGVDLDNTLYPHHVNRGSRSTRRSARFVSAWLKVSPDEARKIQKDYYRRYGTTMPRHDDRARRARRRLPRLMCHKIGHSPLEPNPAMGEAIASLTAAKLILTNGSTDHVDAVRRGWA